MAKRKITVTVDDAVVEEARRAALRELLDFWDTELGPVAEEDFADAQAAFDELDGASSSGQTRA